MFLIVKQWICCSVDFEVHICVFSPRQLGTSAGNLHTSWCFNLQNSYWISLYYITFWRQHLFTCLCYSSSWNDRSKKAKVHCVVKQHYHLPNLPCLFWLALFFWVLQKTLNSLHLFNPFSSQQYKILTSVLNNPYFFSTTGSRRWISSNIDMPLAQLCTLKKGSNKKRQINNRAAKQTN